MDPSEHDLTAAKAALRRDLLARIARLDPTLARRAAAAVASRVVTLPELPGNGGLLVCLSYGREIDTRALVTSLLAAGRSIYVPRADRTTGQLTVHAYPCEMETLSIGLEQPRSSVPPVPADRLDEILSAALVVGVGFDRLGHRLGYGRGYFDRFLSGRRFAAIGLAYREQLVDRLPAEPHDVRMAAVVTDAETVRPPSVAG